MHFGKKIGGIMKKILKILSFVLLFLCISCSAFAQINIPYSIKGDLSIEESELYDYVGFNFSIKNKSEKRINTVTVVFYVFDENGEPPFGMKNHIVLNLNCTIEPGEILEDCLSLDNYVYCLDSERYEIDYLYVSRISYDDGSVWSDPFGTFVQL